MSSLVAVCFAVFFISKHSSVIKRSCWALVLRIVIRANLLYKRVSQWRKYDQIQCNLHTLRSTNFFPNLAGNCSGVSLLIFCLRGCHESRCFPSFMAVLLLQRSQPTVRCFLYYCCCRILCSNVETILKPCKFWYLTINIKYLPKEHSFCISLERDEVADKLNYFFYSCLHFYSVLRSEVMCDLVEVF